MANKQSLSMKKTQKFDFVKQGKWFMLGSLILIIIGIVVMAVVGLKPGMDFTGGNILQFEIGVPLEEEQNFTKDFKPTVKQVLSDSNVNMQTARIDRQIGAEGNFIVVRFQDIKGQDMEQLRVTIRDEIIIALEALPTHGLSIDPATQTTATSFERGVSNSFIKGVIIALPIAIVLMLIYLVFRFEFWSALCAFIGILHDAVIALAFVAICGITVDSAFIAAILAVLIFSVNNSIVIFDKIKETYRKETKDDWKDHVNHSVKSTLVRNAIMTLVTLTAVIMLIILGVGPVKQFVTPILIGLVAGMYSTIFVVPALFEFIARKRNVQLKSRFASRNKPQETPDTVNVPTVSSVKPTATPNVNDDQDGE